MTTFTLKLVAMIAMLFDHIAAIFGWNGWDILPFDTNWIRMIGRVSFPIFAFCLVNGWQLTKNREVYFRNLCLFAVLSQIPFSLAFYPPNTMHTISAEAESFRFIFSPFSFAVAFFCIFIYSHVILREKIKPSLFVLGACCLLPSFFIKWNYIWILADELNVLYTLALGAAMLYLFDRLKQKEGIVWICLAVILAILCYGIHADYGIGLMGLTLIAGLYLFSFDRRLQSGAVLVWGCLYYGWMLGNWSYALVMVVPAAMILLYNGKKGYAGKGAKHLFYAFYPLHLLVLGMINICLKWNIGL